MMKIYKKIILLAFLLVSSTLSYAQYSVTNLETGMQNSALAKDASGSIYTTRYQAPGFYEIVKYTNGVLVTPAIKSGIVAGGFDLSWGLAIAANGDVYYTTSFANGAEGSIKRLEAANGYAETEVQAGRYFTGLAFDNQNRLYALEVRGGNFAVVRYNTPSVANSSGIVLNSTIPIAGGLTYPTSISVASDLTIYCNNAFDFDGSNPNQGGIIKLTTANSGTSYTRSDLNSTKFTTALYIDEFNNLYAIEALTPTSKYRLYKYTNGTGTPTQFHNADFASAYPNLAYGITAQSNVVYAIDGDDGVNGGSKLLKLTPADTNPPAVPTGLAATFTGGSKVNLTWNANVESDLNGYHIYRISPGNPTPISTYVAKGSNTVQITGLTSGTVYSFTIASVDNAFNESIQSTTVNITPQKPIITSATYAADTKILTVTGTNILELSGVANDIVANKFTITAEGGVTRTLTAANVDRTSATAFSVTLGTNDQTALNTIINKNSTTSTGGTTYNLAVATGWAAGEDISVNTAQATIPLTVSNVAVPTIASATYNAGTGVFVVTGNNLLSLSGSANDIIVNKFTITGEGAATYTLTSTTNVEITNANTFTITLNATDKAGVYFLLNKNGTQSAGNTVYNLAAADDWNAGADAALNIADLTGNGITVSNVDPVLPVVLASFTATKSEREITLNWRTSSELNSDVFVLSKSTDGVNFMEIDRVKAAGNSTKTVSYSSIDKSPYAGIAYYKLLQLDMNAKIGLEKILPVNFLLTTDMVVLYPNPVVNDLHIKVSDSRFTKAILIDVNGKLLKSYRLNAGGGVSTINLDMLAKGVYMLKLTGGGEQIIRKVIKN
jgi:hypothetical protein